MKRSRKTRRSPRRHLLVSCEHGGNEVPREYAAQFCAAADVLDSHRGLDYGALDVARAFGERLDAEPEVATTTRLVVDLNRSPYHRNVFSEYMQVLTRQQRATAMDEHYWPYRNEVEGIVDRAIRSGAFVLHVSSHSFTPVLHGEVRNCDIGLLYDPQRALEVAFIDAWRAAFAERAPQLVVRRNYPYRGTADALVTHLRRRHDEWAYAGVEIEVNQKHVRSAAWTKIVALLADTLGSVLDAA